MHTIKWGVIGAGAAGQNHLRVLTGMPEIEVRSVCDLDQTTVGRLLDQYGLKHGFTDYRALLADQTLDAVSVATSENTHYEIVMEAARNKKHVLCEKPLSTTIEEARSMIRAMDEQQRLLSVSFNYRQNRVMLRIKEYLDQGIIGAVKVIRLIHLGEAPDLMMINAGWTKERAEARLAPMMAAGGPIFDCGVHQFDIARVFAGSEIVNVEAKGCGMRGFVHPDHTVAVCYHENGVMSVVENSFTYAFRAKERKEHIRRDIIGDRGSIMYDYETELLQVHHSEGTIREKIPYPSHNEDREGIYKEFAASISEGRLRKTIASGLDGMKAIEAAMQAVESQMRP